MIKSMTGFGKATSELNGKKLVVEVKSLNSKQLDASLRLPSIYREKELEIRNRIKNVAERGKVDMLIYFDNGETENVAVLNVAVVEQYLAQVKAMNEKLGLSVDDASLLKTIIRFPDTMQVKSDVFDESEWNVLMSTVDSALKMLDDYRINEGAVLIADILRRVQLIEDYSKEIPKFEEARVPVIKQRLQERLNEWLDPKIVDQNRLEQELIYYLEKLDITEEKVRLANHCAYFRETVKSEEAPGRKIAFIAQEMGREINTTGSKANDANIQQIVVKMKDELEKIKEQSLNIL